MFDEMLIGNLPESPQLAGKKICDEFNSFRASIPDGHHLEYYEDYLKAIAMLLAFSEVYGVTITAPPISSNINTNITRIVDVFKTASSTFDLKFTMGTLEHYKKAFIEKFEKGFLFEFSEGDLKRIQTLVSELKELIAQTHEINEQHRLRLFKRLEKIQTELHKKVSDLDRFWGLLIDASIVLKKIGENAKPIVERIQEIINIVWRVQARAEELPSNVPLEIPSGDKR